MKHHVIDTRKDAYDMDAVRLFFSVDFEPVEFWISSELKRVTKEYYRQIFFTMTKDVWQHVIDLTTETLGKEQRDVFAKRDILPDAGKMCYEYLADGGGFGWEYFIKTKTYHVNNCFKCDENHGSFHHFRKVEEHLKYQGLNLGYTYYSPSPAAIDRITKALTKNL